MPVFAAATKPLLLALRRWVGQSLFAPLQRRDERDPGGKPDRVFLSRVGRVEVYLVVHCCLTRVEIRRTAHARSSHAVTPQTHSRRHGSCAERMD